MSLRFDGEVAVVTGAGGGMGMLYARELGRRGAAVVVNDIGGAVDGTGTDDGPARRVADAIVAEGGRAVAVADSVATAEGGQAVVDAALDAFGRLDIVINNAGILISTPFEQTDFGAVRRVLDVHLMGAFHVSVPAYRVMIERGGGRFLNTASSAALGSPTFAAYAAAKGGVIGLTRVIAAEGAAHGVRANAVLPLAATRMTREAFGPLADLLAPGFVVPTACWLVHDSCSTSGEMFSVGAGHVSRVFIGETAGWTETVPTEHDVDAVARNFGAVCDENGYTVPADTEQEMRLILDAVGAPTT